MERICKIVTIQFVSRNLLNGLRATALLQPRTIARRRSSARDKLWANHRAVSKSMMIKLSKRGCKMIKEGGERIGKFARRLNDVKVTRKTWYGSTKIFLRSWWTFFANTETFFPTIHSNAKPNRWCNLSLWQLNELLHQNDPGRWSLVCLLAHKGSVEGWAIKCPGGEGVGKIVPGGKQTWPPSPLAVASLCSATFR